MSILTLGIESSCDETAAAVVSDGRVILSDVIASQADFHSQYGGVVPEIASRMHVEAIIPCISEALKKSGTDLKDMDAICVTKGPGLVGALLVGVSAAKGLSEVSGLPLIGVGHIQSHIAANYLTFSELEPPFVGLIVSGGHTEIAYVEDYCSYRIIGKTRDDAAGEAIDKLARVIGLGYPGGPKMDLAGQSGDKNKYSFPKTFFKESFDFSFSGIKTYALNLINQYQMNGQNIDVTDFSASYQNAITDVLVENSINACISLKCYNLCMAGGVSANTFLRAKISERAREKGISIFFPPVRLCTDNASMVASAGYYSFRNGIRDDLAMNAYPSYSF